MFTVFTICATSTNLNHLGSAENEKFQMYLRRLHHHRRYCVLVRFTSCIFVSPETERNLSNESAFACNGNMHRRTFVYCVNCQATEESLMRWKMYRRNDLTRKSCLFQYTHSVWMANNGEQWQSEWHTSLQLWNWLSKVVSDFRKWIFEMHNGGGEFLVGGEIARWLRVFTHRTSVKATTSDTPASYNRYVRIW